MATNIDQKIVDFITQDQDNALAKDLDLYYGDDDLAKDVIRNKYFAPWETCPFDLWVRLAWACSEAEKEEDRLDWARKFYNVLFDFTFIPGGRIIASLGRKDITASFSNCYVLPIKEDSLEAIYECLKEDALTYKAGGGCGNDLSVLRPRNDLIKKTGGRSCGVNGYLDLFSTSTNCVAQNNRRGALMLSLSVDHPDVEEFIDIKNDAVESIKALQELANKYPQENAALKVIKDQIESRRKVQYANISVKITDEFMDCMLNDKDFDLRWGGKVYKTVKAKELWNKIIKSAYKSAEPGIQFWDRMKRTNNTENIVPILGTNPCSEIFLQAYGSCLLGSLNLIKFIKENGLFNFDKLDEISRVGQRFLDNVITLGDGKHPIKEQNETALALRRMGFGLTGIGDCLILLKQKYGSKESLETLSAILESFRNSVYAASCDLAAEKGPFPLFDKEDYLNAYFVKTLPQCIRDGISKFGIRNCNLLTEAPNGSLSIIAQTTSGIEPIFRTSYKRKVKNNDSNSYTTYTTYHPLVKRLFPEGNIPDYVVDSTQISPEERVKVQGTIQKYIDHSISSTVNLPKTATEKDVEDVYLLGWKCGVKGITVYVDESREGSLLENTENKPMPVQNIRDNRNAMKRPKVLQGETHKRKVDLNGQEIYNCYLTVNYEPNTRNPYEILINETYSTRDMKSVMMLETTSRLISLALRHGVPVEFVVQQLNKVRGSYIYSLPKICADILSNYIVDEDGLEGTIECPECGGNMKKESGCSLCMDCGFSKCG